MMKNMLIYILLMFISQPFVNAQGFANSSWPMFGHDPAHTHRGPEVPPATSTLKWKFKADIDEIFSCPSTGSDGTIYVCSYVAATDTSDAYGRLYALNPDGTMKWRFLTDGPVFNSYPAVGADGTVYIGSQDNHIYAVNDDGTLKWKYETGDAIVESPVIDNNGTVYFVSRDTCLYAFSPEGDVQWIFTTDRGLSCTPAISKDGTIYVGTGEYYLYALNTDGELLWKYYTGQRISSPALGSDGTVYVGAGRNIYAFNPDGTVLWKRETEDNIHLSLSNGSDGTIYAGQTAETFEAINPDGTLQWSFFRKYNFFFYPAAVGSDGCLYLCGRNSVQKNSNYLYAINPDGSLRWEVLINPVNRRKIDSTPVIADDGTLYLSLRERIFYENDNVPYTDTSYIFAFAPETTTSVNEEPEPVIVEPYPNPFNQSTKLLYTLDAPSHVKLSVYSVSGQKVVTLVDSHMSAGRHSVKFDGSHLAAGVYFYRFESPGFIKSGKMLLVK